MVEAAPRAEDTGPGGKLPRVEDSLGHVRETLEEPSPLLAGDVFPVAFAVTEIVIPRHGDLVTEILHRAGGVQRRLKSLGKIPLVSHILRRLVIDDEEDAFRRAADPIGEPGEHDPIGQATGQTAFEDQGFGPIGGEGTVEEHGQHLSAPAEKGVGAVVFTNDRQILGPVPPPCLVETLEHFLEFRIHPLRPPGVEPFQHVVNGVAQVALDRPERLLEALEIAEFVLEWTLFEALEPRERELVGRGRPQGRGIAHGRSVPQEPRSPEVRTPAPTEPGTPSDPSAPPAVPWGAMFAHVAIPRSAPEPLVYGVPDEFRDLIRPGIRVRVPLRKRQTTGIVVETSPTTEIDTKSVREILEVLDAESLLPEHILGLARFVSSYYRCPLGTTLAAMLPAGLLRADAEYVEPSPLGAAVDPEILPRKQQNILSLLLEKGRTPVPTLLARAGAASRNPLDALHDAGLVVLGRRRRDRPPRAEVGAVALLPEPLETLLERCGRAPRQQKVLEWLAEREGPVLESELLGAVGCSSSVLKGLEDKGLVRRFRQNAARKPRWSLGGTDVRHRLNAEQQAAVDAVGQALDRREYAPILLEGVTGSGKTEVYLRCLEATLALDRQGIVLVPEIGLTPATVGAVERRFGSSVAVLHSAQAEGERWREWRTVRSGDARIVVGPRSALFAPLERPGLIVVDEEHDAAYKQQESPRYNARDLALVLGRDLRIPVLLCSATPSTEASFLETRGLARRLRLRERVGGGVLPQVDLVDLRHEPPEPGEQGRTLFSRPLKEAIGETLEKGRQIILLMQRRGWAPVLLCRECGHKLQCPDCSVSLVVHRRRREMECHYCGRHTVVPDQCPSCGGSLLDAVGAGTEKVADHVRRLFPDVPAAILDRDTVRRRSGLEETLGAFADGRIRILVGTQMVAKGHHFPNVTLTGVISADALLGLPDFRAGERTFQLLTQVAGRSGRGAEPGRVIIQTYHPDHPAVLHAASHDVGAFTAEELKFRRAFGYPPVMRMALVRFESPSPEKVRRAAEAAGRLMRPAPEGVRVRGPAPAPMERLKDRWRWQILLTAAERPPLRRALHRIECESLEADVHRIVDVDPLSTL